MSRQRESRLSTKILAELRKQGYFCYKNHGSEYMMAGLPDIIVCAEGIFIGLETKLPESRGDTTPRQRHVHRLIRHAGGHTAVVCSTTEALAFVKRVLDAAHSQD